MNDGDGKIVGGGGIGMVSWKCVIGNKMIGAVWGACFVNSALEVKVGGCLGVRRPIFVFSLQIFTFRQNPLLMCDSNAQSHVKTSSYWLGEDSM